jgi:uncharacterized membrane protein
MVALFIAKLISTFGSWLTILALPWFSPSFGTPRGLVF